MELWSISAISLLFSVVICHENQVYPPGVPPPHQHMDQQEYVKQQEQQFVHQQQQGYVNEQQQLHDQRQQGLSDEEYRRQQEQQKLSNEQHSQHGAGGSKLMESAIDAEHMKEHLEGIMNKAKEDMTQEELQFYYFKVHDYDNNGKLDGTELIKAITHFHNDHAEANPDVEEQGKVFSDKEMSDIVEAIMQQDDFNQDGYIEYVEFVKAQKRPPPEAEQAAPPPPPAT